MSMNEQFGIFFKNSVKKIALLIRFVWYFLLAKL